VLLATVPILVVSVFGQEVVSTAAPTAPSAVDPTLATGGIITSAIVGGLAIYNDRKDKKEMKSNVKGTDVDSAKMFVLYNKILQYAYLYPEYTLKQILDLPATANVMDKETIGQVIARETNGWADFIQERYHVARPTMSVATSTGVHAAQDAAQNPPTVNTATEK
jgi:hypothetical protein